MKILQVVGFKKSGKTNLINRWIRLCKEHSLNVTTIKHHGHNSPLATPDLQVDSMQHFQSGADQTIVYGANVVQVHQRRDAAPSLSQLIDYASYQQPDIIFVEGFKCDVYPKVVLLNHSDDWEELAKLSNIKLVVTSCEVPGVTFDVLSPEGQETMDKWLLNWLEGYK